ncbi:MAG: type II secretion system protein GspJ [Polyangiales bacterium]
MLPALPGVRLKSGPEGPALPAFRSRWSRATRRGRVRRGAQARAGVTLIEALVAITILAMIGTMIWGGVVQTSRSKRAVEVQLEQTRGLRATLQRLARELSMAYVSVHVNPSTNLQAVRTAFICKRKSRGDRVDFVAFSHRRLKQNAHESDQEEISYFITGHPEKRGLQVLARRSQSPPDDDPQKGGRIEVLLEDVREFRLRFFDPIQGDWREEWNTTQAADQPNRLPAQIEIKLTVPHPRKAGKTMTLATRTTLPIQHAINHAQYNY